MRLHEGKYSHGEARHTLLFRGAAADKVAAELAPHSVTKTEHFKLLLELLAEPFTANTSTYDEHINSSTALNSNPTDNILQIRVDCRHVQWRWMPLCTA